MITLASICDPAIWGSLVGGDKQPLTSQKCGDTLWTFTMLNELPESSRHMLQLFSPDWLDQECLMDEDHHNIKIVDSSALL